MCLSSNKLEGTWTDSACTSTLAAWFRRFESKGLYPRRKRCHKASKSRHILITDEQLPTHSSLMASVHFALSVTDALFINAQCLVDCSLGVFDDTYGKYVFIACKDKQKKPMFYCTSPDVDVLLRVLGPQCIGSIFGCFNFHEHGRSPPPIVNCMTTTPERRTQHFVLRISSFVWKTESAAARGLLSIQPQARSHPRTQASCEEPSACSWPDEPFVFEADELNTVD
jgi:hypothetical protein